MDTRERKRRSDEEEASSEVPDSPASLAGVRGQRKSLELNPPIADPSGGLRPTRAVTLILTEIRFTQAQSYHILSRKLIMTAVNERYMYTDAEA